MEENSKENINLKIFKTYLNYQKHKQENKTSI